MFTTAQQHMPTASGVPTTAAGGAVGGQAGSNSREKIWTGILEWIEKAKSDQPKIARHVPCYVTTNIKDGEPELYVIPHIQPQNVKFLAENAPCEC